MVVFVLGINSLLNLILSVLDFYFNRLVCATFSYETLQLTGFPVLYAI